MGGLVAPGGGLPLPRSLMMVAWRTAACSCCSLSRCNMIAASRSLANPSCDAVAAAKDAPRTPFMCGEGPAKIEASLVAFLMILFGPAVGVEGDSDSAFAALTRSDSAFILVLVAYEWLG